MNAASSRQLDELMASRFAKRSKILRRGIVRRADFQYLAGRHAIQRFTRSQHRQRTGQAGRV
jgi:hypothetical protein